jgi:hypothetical protein
MMHGDYICPDGSSMVSCGEAAEAKEFAPAYIHTETIITEMPITTTVTTYEYQPTTTVTVTSETTTSEPTTSTETTTTTSSETTTSEPTTSVETNTEVETTTTGGTTTETTESGTTTTTTSGTTTYITTWTTYSTDQYGVTTETVHTGTSSESSGSTEVTGGETTTETETEGETLVEVTGTTTTTTSGGSTTTETNTEVETNTTIEGGESSTEIGLVAEVQVALVPVEHEVVTYEEQEVVMEITDTCDFAKPCLHDGANNNTCYAQMNLHGTMVCPQGTSLETVNTPVEEDVCALNHCSEEQPCLHEGENNNQCFAKMNLHGTMVCPQGTSPECAETKTTVTTIHLEAVADPVLTVL